MFTRSMSHKEVDFVSYVDSKFADLKEKFVKELKEDLLSSITSLINEQNRQIENLNDKLTKQNSTISVLQNNVEVLNEQCSKLRKDINTKCDELEQYSRRQCLRIEGIVKPRKEKVEDVINLVKDCFAEANVDIPDTVLDRARRFLPVYKDESDQNIQGIIVKFNNFRYRSMFYKNRKKLKGGKRVRIDLTSNRYNLLKKTNALIKRMKMENTVYTFADVNCRLKVVNKENGEEAFFDNLEEVDLFLSQT